MPPPKARRQRSSKNESRRKLMGQGKRAMKPILALLLVLLSPRLVSGPASVLAAQQPQPPTPRIRVDVNMVQLNVAVTDSKGDYVTGLQPRDFVIMEDGVPQTIATFSEG